MNDWKEVVVSIETPLREAIAQIDQSGLQVAVVLNPDKTLAGLLSDGDVRRALLAGKNLDVDVAKVMNPQPTVAPVSMPRSKMLVLMRRLVIHHLPLVNEKRQVVGLVTLDELIGAVDRPSLC